MCTLRSWMRPAGVCDMLSTLPPSYLFGKTAQFVHAFLFTVMLASKRVVSQAYREMLQQIHSDLSLSRIDPEVCLAVRVKASADSVPSSTATSDEDAESMDEFAASCGFEFVDDTRPSSARTIEHEDGMPSVAFV
jgi:hypothetical protein